MEKEDMKEVVDAVTDLLEPEFVRKAMWKGPEAAEMALTAGWLLIERKVREQVGREIREYASGLRVPGGQAANALFATATRIERKQDG